MTKREAQASIARNGCATLGSLALSLILSLSHSFLPKAAFAITRWVATTLMAIAIGAGEATAGTSDSASDRQCDGALECGLHLVADEERPFLWQGKVVGDPEADIPDKMRNLLEGPVRKYPSLASCMSNPEMIAQDLGQAKLRWSEFTSQYEVEVCLFRVLNTIGSPEAIEAWLTRQGFAPSETSRGWELVENYANRDGRFLALQMIWDNKKNGPLYGSRWWQIGSRWLVKRTILFVNISENGGLLHVDLLEQSK